MAPLVFDGHNDVLLTPGGVQAFVSGRGEGHLDLPRAREGGLAGGVFAVFTKTPGDDESAPVDHAYALATATSTAGRLFALEAAGAVRVVRAVGDLDAAVSAGVLAAVLHLEGAEAISPSLRELDAWYEAGLRSLGLVWSRPNAFGHGVPFAYPSSPDTGPGLTSAGVALVRRCLQVGVLVDVSHLNEAGFWDVARECGDRPFVASHSGAWELCNASRNLVDAQLDAIAAAGGLVGIVFAAPFVRPDGADDPDTPLSDVVAHVRYVADRIGVDHVGLGSDFDGATMPSALCDASRLPALLDALREDGFSAEEVERIAFGNWRRVLEDAWE